MYVYAHNRVASLLAGVIRPTLTGVRRCPPPRKIEVRALGEDSSRAERKWLREHTYRTIQHWARRYALDGDATEHGGGRDVPPTHHPP
eukprot:1624093-Pleurochrysis_carterae.AAC.1